ncbi:hypothetical protein EJ110_NYTH49604 [Nymphaea thermarum]|nr:hypothetical protein EJ110_NYTH49604 [Nymphaea thermarum]
MIKHRPNGSIFTEKRFKEFGTFIIDLVLSLNVIARGGIRGSTTFIITVSDNIKVPNHSNREDQVSERVAKSTKSSLTGEPMRVKVDSEGTKSWGPVTLLGNKTNPIPAKNYDYNSNGCGVPSHNNTSPTICLVMQGRGRLAISTQLVRIDFHGEVLARWSRPTVALHLLAFHWKRGGERRIIYEQGPVVSWVDWPSRRHLKGEGHLGMEILPLRVRRIGSRPGPEPVARKSPTRGLFSLAVPSFLPYTAWVLLGQCREEGGGGAGSGGDRGGPGDGDGGSGGGDGGSPRVLADPGQQMEPSPAHSDVHTPQEDNTSGQLNAQASLGAQTPPRQTPPVDQQALLLTTLQTLTSIVQSMAGNQRSQASPTGDTTAPPKEKATTVTFHHFMTMQPPIFTGDGSPDKAEEWIEEIERIFEVLEVPGGNKVKYGSYMLKGDAQRWWKSTREIQFADQQTISWRQFKDSFFSTYFPVQARNKKMQEFLDLQQNHLSLEEYVTKYRHLEAYCPHLYTTAEARADKFTYGLWDGL